MSRELEQWLLEEREEGENRVAALFKRMKADGRLQDFSDALDDKTLREKLYKDTVSNDWKAPRRTCGAFLSCLKILLLYYYTLYLLLKMLNDCIVRYINSMAYVIMTVVNDFL